VWRGTSFRHESEWSDEKCGGMKQMLEQRL
jgi:hypothetical protein